MLTPSPASDCRPSPMLEGGPAGVEADEQVDVDDRLESVGRHSEHGSRKVSGGTTYHEIYLAVGFACGLDGGGKRVVLSHVNGMRGRCSAFFYYFLCRRVEFLFSAADERNVGAVRGETARDDEIDAAAAASYQRIFPLQQLRCKRLHHPHSAAENSASGSAKPTYGAKWREAGGSD